MFQLTDTTWAPWTVIKSNDKKVLFRIGAMRYVLSLFDYPNQDPGIVGKPDPLIVGPRFPECTSTERRRAVLASPLLRGGPGAGAPCRPSLPAPRWDGPETSP